MKTCSKGVIIPPDRRAVRAMVEREARAWRGITAGVRLTPIGRALLLPPSIRRYHIADARNGLESARVAMSVGLELGKDGFHTTARFCFVNALGRLRRARAHLSALFDERGHA